MNALGNWSRLLTATCPSRFRAAAGKNVPYRGTSSSRSTVRAGHQGSAFPGRVTGIVTAAGSPPDGDCVAGPVAQPGDLGITRVGLVAGLLECLKSFLEFGAQVRIGATAVERGAVDAEFTGEGLDVASAAGRDVAAQEPVGSGANAVLVGGTLIGGDPHVTPDCPGAAASMASQDAQRPVVVGLQSCPFGLAGGR